MFSVHLLCGQMFFSFCHPFEHYPPLIIFSVQILFHLTDIICFGALPPCSVCQYGKFFFHNSAYFCTGYNSPWSKCINSIECPQRLSIELPTQYQDLLEEQPNVRARIIRNMSFEFKPEDFE